MKYRELLFMPVVGAVGQGMLRCPQREGQVAVPCVPSRGRSTGLAGLLGSGGSTFHSGIPLDPVCWVTQTEGSFEGVSSVQLLSCVRLFATP